MTKWKIVPVEPSEEMDSAFSDAIIRWLDEEGTNADVYKAMLAAAPRASENEALEQMISDLFNTYDSETDDPVLFARAVLKALEG